MHKWKMTDISFEEWDMLSTKGKKTNCSDRSDEKWKRFITDNISVNK